MKKRLILVYIKNFKMKKHSKLTKEQRYQLSTLQEAGTSQKEIAKIL